MVSKQLSKMFVFKPKHY